VTTVDEIKAEVDRLDGLLSAAKVHLAVVTQTGLHVDGIRDPSAPCTAFVTGDPAGTCQTDGHYICDECIERATCSGCGERPSRCECPVEPDEAPIDAFERALMRGAT